MIKACFFKNLQRFYTCALHDELMKVLERLFCFYEFNRGGTWQCLMNWLEATTVREFIIQVHLH